MSKTKRIEYFFENNLFENSKSIVYELIAQEIPCLLVVSFSIDDSFVYHVAVVDDWSPESCDLI